MMWIVVAIGVYVIIGLAFAEHEMRRVLSAGICFQTALVHGIKDFLVWPFIVLAWICLFIVGLAEVVTGREM